MANRPFNGTRSGPSPPGPPSAPAPGTPLRLASLTAPSAFALEQQRLASTWTLLGRSGDLERDGDWLRASLATRSVFVQRFGQRLRAFENVCAHRGHPLRTADRGNGPVICPFHHWHYDGEGRAIGIPKCRELFGTTPRPLDGRLAEVELSQCGDLLFGRFAPDGGGPGLETWLGETFPIIAALSKPRGRSRRLEGVVQANWKFCLEVNLDDYHIVAVHPRTLGRHGHLRPERMSYFRTGVHSAYFTNPDPGAHAAMAGACRDGTWRSADFRLFHIFPNLIVAHFEADRSFWYVLVLQFVPQAPDRTRLRAWYHPAPFPADRTPLRRHTAFLSERLRPHVVGLVLRHVMRQDAAICEGLQSVAHQLPSRRRAGAFEQRVTWFEEALDAALGDERP